MRGVGVGLEGGAGRVLLGVRCACGEDTRSLSGIARERLSRRRCRIRGFRCSSPFNSVLCVRAWLPEHAVFHISYLGVFIPSPNTERGEGSRNLSAFAPAAPPRAAGSSLLYQLFRSTRMPTTQGTVPPLRVVIVGRGFAGLSAAIACARQGFEVVLLERGTGQRYVLPSMPAVN